METQVAYRGYTLRDIAAIRGLVPNKGDLPTNKAGIDRAIRWFELNQRGVSMEMLHQLSPPAQGDITWAVFALANSNDLPKPVFKR